MTHDDRFDSPKDGKSYIFPDNESRLFEERRYDKDKNCVYKGRLFDRFDPAHFIELTKIFDTRCNKKIGGENNTAEHPAGGMKGPATGPEHDWHEGTALAVYVELPLLEEVRGVLHKAHQYREKVRDIMRFTSCSFRKDDPTKRHVVLNENNKKKRRHDWEGDDTFHLRFFGLDTKKICSSNHGAMSL
ncbi:unnamed protein product [Vitrella brassicaformis CCMP3155]|uniref:Uncharacterized protein n=1 Tax=Vitrella brassicaformis (strain CCMP3155) TaxID=1169540 RepID=A0A0G4ELG3_VITBC|nr:unnamed protein product [Vitrella brassicaformis CCMP3155]|eukprot:CEL97792.1 unnamed protein product [Vitrella brassicaformis CCMP3155]